MTDSDARPDMLKLNTPGTTLSHADISALDPSEHPEFGHLTETLPPESVRTGIYVAMRNREKILATKSFGTARGELATLPEESRSQVINYLAHDYVFFGIASGIHEAQELIRALERNASDQAIERFGPGKTGL